jgi:hypothetical protein
VTQPVSATKRILYIYLRYSCPFVPDVDSTGETVSLHIHKQNAESDQSDDTRIYQLAKSPIRFNKVEEYVINYPRKYEVI